MPFYLWSQTAATNGTADPTALFPEGQAPSSLNDGNRGQMAALAKWGADISGAIVTSGSSTAYTVSSLSGYDTLAHLNGQMIAFTPHTTNGATVTLNVDSLGAKPLRSSPSVEIQAGTIVQGTPYIATYSNTDGAFYLQGFYGNPYNVPLGAGLPFFASTAPNSSFVFPFGQAISRTTYATLFVIFSTQYGPGDGSTTFNLPDLRGRVLAGVDNMGGSAANRLTSTYFGASPGLGATGGLESHTLLTAELPVHSHANFLTENPHSHGVPFSNNFSGGASGGAAPSGTPGTTTTAVSTGITITNANAGSGNAHAIVQPTIECNFILRII